jgi:hypothetical protein
MSVVLDCESIQAGFISTREPRILRIRATVSFTDSHRTRKLTSTAVQTSDTDPELW